MLRMLPVSLVFQVSQASYVRFSPGFSLLLLRAAQAERKKPACFPCQRDAWDAGGCLYSRALP